MIAIGQDQPAQIQTANHRILFWILLACLGLRIGLVTGSRLLFADVPGWILPTFSVCTYALTAAFLVIASDSLTDFHVTPLAIWFIILFKPLETIYQATLYADLNSLLAFPRIPSLLIWGIALGLAIRFRNTLFTWQVVNKREMRWIGIAIPLVLVEVLLTGYLQSIHLQPVEGLRKTIPFELLGGLVNIPYQWGYAAVSEEPVFRGLLWGVLKKSGWRDVWIWLFQAGLFTLAHIDYLNGNPLMFFVIVPIGGIFLGWLAWRSRSIATSSVAHWISNGLFMVAANIIASLR
jgi:membrane protease YdiL (CAAX protease family)